MKNKTGFKILIVLVLVLVLGILAKYLFFDDNTQNGVQTNAVEEELEIIETSTNINVAEVETVNYTNYTANINLSTGKFTGTGVNYSNGTITIVQSGTFHITGTLNNGNIVVNANNCEVILVLDSVNITSSKTSAINVVKAKNVTISLKEGTTNTITDASEYTEFTEDDEPNAAIFSKSDLYITGKGKLIVKGNYQDGIVSKDCLAIVDAEIEVEAKDDGIRGKDYTSINNANVTVKANCDGIKATNDTDSSLGYIVIKDSKITIEAGNDGIQAETVLNITESEVDIETTGDISNSEISSKGLKATVEITINSGNFVINSTDDSIHSNKYIIINNGEFELSTKDDGIHADNNILINNGKINIKTSYEGIEADYIKINNGDITVKATDDGINVSGGDGSQMMGPMGGDSFANISSNRQLVINGGNIYVDSDGDGLDANGSIIVNDGLVIVAGTQSSGNSALDYDGTFEINGGVVYYYGSSGMWLNPSNTSKQYSICFGVSGNKGDKIVLKDSNDEEIIDFETDKSYQTITISTSEIENGESYSLYVNDKLVSSQEVSSVVTSNVSGNGGMMQGGKQNRGGF